jgi:hypothetical protein
MLFLFIWFFVRFFTDFENNLSFLEFLFAGYSKLKWFGIKLLDLARV